MITAGVSETRTGPAAPLNPGAFAPGTMLADRYRIVALAGRGGMGEVYRAEDLRLGQAVALKFLPPALESDPAALDRLLAEVRNARAVAHPNVCRVYDVGDVQGRAFLTMEYIDGEDLRSLLRRIGRLPPDKALEVARQLTAGLAAAHDRGVLHRDLKPANVMLDGRGQVRITDFGLSVEEGPGSSPSDVAGTVAYMAPERFHGSPATVQSDLYALGLVLYEIFTGKSAFKGATTADWQRAHVESIPTGLSALVPDIDPAVERAILRCLEKEPSRRPASAVQVAAALPGGDPLAAAVAAGETPSPELVAASGAEGTLPRAWAWLWLASCVVGFGVLMLFASLWGVATRTPLPHPALQRERARQILRDLGYSAPAVDHAWWTRENVEYLQHFRTVPDRERTLANAVKSPYVLLFCYRQSPIPLFTVGGAVSDTDPAPVQPGDAYLELGSSGGLVALRVIPSHREASSPSAPVDWAPLLAAIHLKPSALKPRQPEAGPPDPYDTRVAWDGVLDSEPVIIEAGARHGRVTYARVTPAWIAERAGASEGYVRSSPLLSVFVASLMLGALGVIAVLAARNLRLGRGDRRNANRLAAFVFVTGALGTALWRHWALTAVNADTLHISPIMAEIVHTVGISLFFALQTWLAYVGFEPFVRRRWPRLLITSTRLLDARWRDPLVGRSLLAGVLSALGAMVFVFGSFLIILEMGWGVLIPEFTPRGLDGLTDFAAYIARATVIQVSFAFVYLAVLIAAQWTLRNTRAAWTALAIVFFGFFAAWGRAFFGPYPAILVTFAVVLSATSVFVFWKNGLLALAVWLVVVTILRDTPWTIELGHWNATPTWVAAGLIAALTLWGFRNVMGRQSLFPPADD